MRSPLLAQRYARALYQVNPDLDLSGLEFQPALARPNISIDETWKILPAARGRKEIENLIKILHRRKRLKLLPEIIEAYTVNKEQAAGIARASVTTSKELDQVATGSIARTIAASHGAKDVKLDVIVDPSLIGGVMIRIGDTLIDGSVRTRLEEFRARF